MRRRQYFFFRPGIAGPALVLLLGLIFPAGARLKAGEMPTAEECFRLIPQLEALHERLPPPRLGEWLHEYHEDGQTFVQYVLTNPPRPHGGPMVVDVLPLGDFSPAQREVLLTTTEFLSLYFGVTIRLRRAQELSNVPAEATRTVGMNNQRQIQTDYLLDQILLPRRTPDSLAWLGVTNVDLWPDARWTGQFVFGLARIDGRRVAVVSNCRQGDPQGDAEDRNLHLLRACKTAAHELGHALTFPHCIEYKCNMNGTNSRSEADRKPLWLCPHCLAKVCYATGCDPRTRYRRLAEFCRLHGWRTEAEFYDRSAARLAAPIELAAQPAIKTEAEPEPAADSGAEPELGSAAAAAAEEERPAAAVKTRRNSRTDRFAASRSNR